MNDSDIKQKFLTSLQDKKNHIKEETSSFKSLVNALSSEFEEEQKSNPKLRLKKSFSETFDRILKETPIEIENFFVNEEISISDELESEQYEVLEDIQQHDNISEDFKTASEDLISIASEKIFKEESIKPDTVQENYTNFFSQPKTEMVDANIATLQKKLKFLEDWVSKISLSGPGGGAGDVLSIYRPTKTVYSNYTIGRKDYYVGVNPSEKVYISIPNSGIDDGRVIIIKDESGHAQLTPIKLEGLIDNDPNGAELRINNGSITLIYRDGWRII